MSTSQKKTKRKKGLTSMRASYRRVARSGSVQTEHALARVSRPCRGPQGSCVGHVACRALGCVSSLMKKKEQRKGDVSSLSWRVVVIVCSLGPVGPVVCSSARVSPTLRTTQLGVSATMRAVHSGVLCMSRAARSAVSVCRAPHARAFAHCGARLCWKKRKKEKKTITKERRTKREERKGKATYGCCGGATSSPCARLGVSAMLRAMCSLR
jgi:hypothetical protein